MIPYYAYHRKVRLFDPTQEPLQPGDVVCHREALRRVSCAQPLRLRRPAGGGEPVERSEVVLLPEYSRPLPQRQTLRAPRRGRPPPLDTDALCEQLGLEVGTLLQQARSEMDVDRFYRSVERKVLLQQGLGVQSSRELSWLLHLIDEWTHSPPRRSRCFAALLLGRCLHRFRRSADGAERSVGLLRRLLRPVRSAAASLRAGLRAADLEQAEEDDVIRRTFTTLVQLAAPPPHLQLRGALLTVQEPDVCALQLEQLLQQLEGRTGGGEAPAAPAAPTLARPAGRR
jgi:hypothetical protein